MPKKPRALPGLKVEGAIITSVAVSVLPSALSDPSAAMYEPTLIEPNPGFCVPNEKYFVLPLVTTVVTEEANVPMAPLGG